MNKKNKFVGFLRNNYYYFIVILVLIITVICVTINNNKLNKNESIIYNDVLKNRGDFKSPESVKVVSVRVCDKDYSIIKISANNSYGAETTTTYYHNKQTLSTDSLVAKAVVEKCFTEELTDYNSVVVLSSDSISKINKYLKGNKDYE